MSTIGNILWFIVGGFFMGLAWWILGLFAFITIIGIPWGRACFVVGQLAFFPFGKEVISRQLISKTSDIGTGSLGLVGNIIWFVAAGFWLALAHMASALLYCITIIGIPFGIQHFKLARIALAPIGKSVVTKELAAATRQQNS